MNNETILVSAVSGIAASVFSTPLAHWLQSRRHVSERWWETKAEAYGIVLGELARIRVALQDIYAAITGDAEAPDEEALQPAFRRWAAAADAIEAIAQQATFKISPEADRLLRNSARVIRGAPPEGHDSPATHQWLRGAMLEFGLITTSLSIEARHDLRVLGVRGELHRLFGERGSLRRQQLFGARLGGRHDTS